MTARRTILVSGMAALAGCAASSTQTRREKGETYVLVHGAWHGGWCWSRVADILRNGGHRVFTPTQTGLADRKHLMSKAIDLDVFVSDIANLMDYEELDGVTLVGHSFGGLTVTGVADRLGPRIKKLVYLDALIAFDGKAVFDTLPPDVVAQRKKLADESSGGVSLPPPPPSAFGVSDTMQAAWLTRRLTPHPIGTYTSALRLADAPGNGRDTTFIRCTQPAYTLINPFERYAMEQGWRMRSIGTGHDAMVSAPELLAAELGRLS